MCSAIVKHVDKIMEQMVGDDSELEDMRLEFLSHLNESQKHYIENGYSEKDAEKKAILEFGRPDQVAEQMHNAIFPHQRILCNLLGSLSLLITLIIYSASLLIERDAYYIALIGGVLTSSYFLVLGIYCSPKLETKRSMITMLIIHILLFVYHYLIIVSLEHWLVIPVSIATAVTILLSIVLIYRVAMSHPNPEMKWIHFLNISLGILYVGYSLFFLWATLAFFGTFVPVLLLAHIPSLIWCIAYIFQVQFIKRDKVKLAYSFLIASCLMGIPFIWIAFK